MPQKILGSTGLALVMTLGGACNLDTAVDRLLEAGRPCEAMALLSDGGIQGGDEALVAFDCAATRADVGWARPVLEALHAERDESGASLLDQWLEIAQGGAPMSVSDLIALIETGAERLTAERQAAQAEQLRYLVETGAVPSGIDVVHGVARGFTGMTAEQQAQWGDDLSRAMCHDQIDGACSSPLRDMLVAIARAESPRGDASPDALKWILSGGGDPLMAINVAEGIARTTAAFLNDPGDGALVTKLAQGWFLEAYGDDPATFGVYEGYPSRDVEASALYGLLDVLRAQPIRQSFVDSRDETFWITSNRFTFNPDEIGSVSDEPAGCTDGGVSGSEEAPHGFGQVLRLLSVANVDFDDPALNEGCGDLIVKWRQEHPPATPTTGSHNLAVVALELFAFVSPEEAQVFADALNHKPTVEIINQACGVRIDLDDTEALQSAVYQPATLAWLQPILRSLIQSGGLEAFVQAVAAMHEAGVICPAATPMRVFNDPASGLSTTAPAEAEMLPLPSEGPELHDAVTEPMLATVVDLAPVVDRVAEPVVRAATEEAWVSAFAQLIMGLTPLLENPPEATALPAEAEVDQALVAARDLLIDTHKRTLIAETLASVALRDALLELGPSAEPPVLDAFAERYGDGRLPIILADVAAVLHLLQGDATSP